MRGPYDDIINLPHHVSSTRPKMPLSKRAAQFSPFAALTGYDAAIAETGRRTDERIVLGESAIAALDMKLGILEQAVAGHPDIAVTYFQPDELKEGGAYVTTRGELKKLDDVEREIVFMDGSRVAIEDVIEIESELFPELL